MGPGVAHNVHETDVSLDVQSGSPIMAAEVQQVERLEERPGHGSDPRFLCPSGAPVFDDADGAAEAMDVQRSVVVPNTTTRSKPLSISDLGDEAFAFTFDSGPLGKPGAIYFFRVGNAMFLVPGSGAQIKNEDLLAIARLVADRAEG
jgi:hypothetical protein